MAKRPWGQPVCETTTEWCVLLLGFVRTYINVQKSHTINQNDRQSSRYIIRSTVKCDFFFFLPTKPPKINCFLFRFATDLISMNSRHG